MSYLKINIQNLLKLTQRLLLLQQKKDQKKKKSKKSWLLEKNIHPRERNINYKDYVFL